MVEMLMSVLCFILLCLAIYLIVPMFLQEYRDRKNKRKRAFKYGSRGKVIAEAYVKVHDLSSNNIIKSQNVYGLYFDSIYTDNDFNTCSAVIPITKDNYAKFIDLLDKKRLFLIRFSIRDWV